MTKLEQPFYFSIMESSTY